MHYWRTGDEVTDANLSYLENLARWDSKSGKEQTHQLALAVIRVSPMLPALVSSHFELPSPYIGGGAYDWSDAQRAKWIESMTSAISRGLESASLDEALKRDNSPDFSDRPRSRGEVILEALERFRQSRSNSDLSDLSVAIGPTNLHSYFDELKRALVRKRPSPGSSLEVEILKAIGKLDFYARHWFSASENSA